LKTHNIKKALKKWLNHKAGKRLPQNWQEYELLSLPIKTHKNSILAAWGMLISEMNGVRVRREYGVFIREGCYQLSIKAANIRQTLVYVLYYLHGGLKGVA
jgi:hypothetical protein